MPTDEQSNVTDVMSILDSTVAAETEKRKSNMPPGQHRFMFERTEAGEKIRTLVEMRGDEIIRQGVDAAYNYLNGRKAYAATPLQSNSSLMGTKSLRSLLPGFWMFIFGVGLTLLIVSELVPGGLGSIF